MKINEILQEAYKIDSLNSTTSAFDNIVDDINGNYTSPLQFEGQINQFYIYFCISSLDNTWNYILLKNKIRRDRDLSYKSILGIVQLNPIRNLKGFEVEISNLIPELQGRGIGRKLYNHIITRDGVTLISGAAQTPASQNLWMYFANHPEKYRVFLQDIKHPSDKKHIDYDFKQNSLHPEQEEKLYSTHSESTTDWRMVCMKK